MSEEKKEDIQIHYLAYIVLNEASIKQDPTRNKYQYQKIYEDVEVAKRMLRKKLGGWYIAFVIREVIFDDSTVVSDTEIYTENAKNI